MSDPEPRTTEVRLTVNRAPVGRLGPRAIERPGDAGFTLIGLFDDPQPAEVDRSGLLHHEGAWWSLDWWIGAEDRWYFPAREATVRQRRLGAGPILETAVRIPGGDALHRCYRALSGGLAVTVVEVENATATPVTLALALRPYDLTGSRDSNEGDSVGASHTVEVQADQLVIDGTVVLRLPRPPGDRSVSGDDPIVALQTGAYLDGSAAASVPAPHAVLIFPLPHRTQLRFVLPAVPMKPSPSLAGRPIEPASAPDFEAVGRGWTAVVERGGRFVLPDNGLSDRASAARARLVLSRKPFDNLAVPAPGAGLVLQALAASGSRQIVGSVLSEFVDTYPTGLVTPEAGAELAHAVGWAACAHGDAALAQRLLEPLTQLTALVERAGDGSGLAGVSIRGLAWACRAAGQEADSVRLFEQASARSGASVTGGQAATLAEVEELAASGGGAGSFGGDDLVSSARFWLAARGLLVREVGRGRATPRTLELLPDFATAWRGGSIEVHRAQSPLGVLSFAIRWHGYRPAVLWEFEPRGDDVELCCSALDPEWSTTAWKGEALLTGAAERLLSAPDPGDSFA